MPQIWMNGSLTDDSTAAVPVRDTGLLHAAGVFTTMRAVAGKVFRLDQHLTRLRESCQTLSIPLPYDDGTLAAAARETMAANNLADARLRLTVTRGSASADAGGSLELVPAVFLTAAPLQPYPSEFYIRGMTVVLIDDQKLNPYDVQAGHKTLNYLSRLAALRSANLRGAGEALWFDVHNFLQSGSMSNVFTVKNRVLTTPPTPAEMRDPAVDNATPYPRSSVLPGVTRGAVIELARARGWDVRTAAIDVNALLAADEVFLTNSIMGVMPVCRIERSAVGDDLPGPVTKALGAALDAAMR